MSSPFQEHADNFASYQTMLQGDDKSGGAVLTVRNVDIPCTTSQLVTNYDLIPDGRSVKTFFDSVEFLVSDVPECYVPVKGGSFTLKMNPKSKPIPLMFWHGGLQQGGLIYRFMAVSQDWGV